MGDSKKKKDKNKEAEAEAEELQYPEGFSPSQKKKPKSLEDERKYSIILSNAIEEGLSPEQLFEERGYKLLEVFAYVARNNSFFRKLHKTQDAKSFSDNVRSFLKRPIEFTLARTRFYSINQDLTGIDPETGKAETEFRSEYRKDKGRWKHTVKTSKNGVSEGGTVSRDEYEEYMDGPYHNFSAHPEAEDCLREKFGLESNLKILSKIEGQSTKILFHPNGNEDILLEIKFDVQEGMTIDGFTWPVIEIEVEIKSSTYDLGKEEKEQVLQETEDVLYRHFKDDLQRITTSKNARGNIHLCELQSKHPEWFKSTFKSLPYGEFQRRDAPAPDAP